MKTSHFEALPHCPKCSVPGVTNELKAERVRLGEGACFGCMTIRATLARMNRLDDHSIYKKIQWLATQDTLIRETALAQVERELALEVE